MSPCYKYIDRWDYNRHVISATCSKVSFQRENGIWLNCSKETNEVWNQLSLCFLLHIHPMCYEINSPSSLQLVSLGVATAGHRLSSTSSNLAQPLQRTQLLDTTLLNLCRLGTSTCASPTAGVFCLRAKTWWLLHHRDSAPQSPNDRADTFPTAALRGFNELNITPRNIISSGRNLILYQSMSLCFWKTSFRQECEDVCDYIMTGTPVEELHWDTLSEFTCTASVANIYDILLGVQTHNLEPYLLSKKCQL